MSYRKGFILVFLYWGGLLPLMLGGYLAIRLFGPSPSVFIMAALMWLLFGAFLLYRFEQMNHAEEVRALRTEYQDFSGMMRAIAATMQDTNHKAEHLGELYNEEAEILEHMIDQMDAHFGVIESRLPQKKGGIRKHVKGTTSPELTAVHVTPPTTSGDSSTNGTTPSSSPTTEDEDMV